MDPFIERLLDETRDEIHRADNKASIVLAGAGVAVGAIVAGLIAGDVGLADESLFVWLLVIGAGVLVVSGIATMGAAVFPRLGTLESGRARYFSEAAEFKDLPTLTKAIREEATRADERNSHQISVLSSLVQTKYRLTRIGMMLLGVGFVVAGLAGLLSKL